MARTLLQPEDGMVFECRGCEYVDGQPKTARGKRGDREYILLLFRDYHGNLWGIQDYTTYRLRHKENLDMSPSTSRWRIKGKLQRFFSKRENTHQTGYILSHLRRDKPFEQKLRIERERKAVGISQTKRIAEADAEQKRRMREKGKANAKDRGEGKRG